MQTLANDLIQQDNCPSSSVPWTPQQQTARMLTLCEAQMEAALRDSDDSMTDLVKAFKDISRTMAELKKLTLEHDPASSHEAARSRIAKLPQQMESAIVAFQFYDKLTQRLEHVRYSLSTMALFVCDRANSERPEHWEKLLYALGRLYRTAEEREVFNSIAGVLELNGQEQPATLPQSVASAGSIELF